MTHPNFYLETKQDALEHVYISGFNIWLSENSGYEVFGALGLYIFTNWNTELYTSNFPNVNSSDWENTV